MDYNKEAEIRYKLFCDKFSGNASLTIQEFYDDRRGRDVTKQKIGDHLGLRVDLILSKDMDRLNNVIRSGNYESIDRMSPVTWEEYNSSRPDSEQGENLDNVEIRLIRSNNNTVRVFGFKIDNYGASPADSYAKQLISDNHEEGVEMVTFSHYMTILDHARELAKKEK